jgi:hypothetical protein
MPATYQRDDVAAALRRHARDYETLRIGMQTLFAELGITASAAHRQQFVDPRSASA